MLKFRMRMAVNATLLLAACTSYSLGQLHNSVFSFDVPGTGLVLEFPSQGFKLEVADDKPPYYYLSNEKAGLSVSFSFEMTNKCNSGVSCRDYFANDLKASGLSDRNWQTSRLGDAYLLESMDVRSGDVGRKQQRMYAHFVKNGVWVNVHLSKIDSQESDRALFINFIRSIQFWQKP